MDKKESSIIRSTVPRSEYRQMTAGGPAPQRVLAALDRGFTRVPTAVGEAVVVAAAAKGAVSTFGTC